MIELPEPVFNWTVRCCSEQKDPYRDTGRWDTPAECLSKETMVRYCVHCCRLIQFSSSDFINYRVELLPVVLRPKNINGGPVPLRQHAF